MQKVATAMLAMFRQRALLSPAHRLAAQATGLRFVDNTTRTPPLFLTRSLADRAADRTDLIGEPREPLHLVEAVEPAPADVTLGRAIAAAVKAACVSSDAVTFKEDELTWGVTAADAQRLAARSFGDYKSPTRLKAEVALANYMSKFSEPRNGFIGTYSIASCIAAPGTGKSRLLDDAVRGDIAAELDANGALARSFDPRDKLLLAISFNGGTTRRCVFQVASRCVLEFFCGQPKDMRADSADSVLEKIDSELERLLPGHSVLSVHLSVLNALEALFFHVRGAALGRTVLLVDEIALAPDQLAVHDSIVGWIDNAPIAVGRGYLGRRGAVVTNITLWSPWDTTSESARPVVPIALGLFDVWSADVKDAILRDVQKYPRWSNVRTLPDNLWTLLASTGGRPRDIESILKSLHNNTSELERVLEDRLWHVLSEGVSPDPTFKSYLLPSMLSVQFVAGKKTQFGRQVASRALLNADLLVGGCSAVPAVPAVSLRYAECLPGGGNLRSVFPRLVRDTTFYDLRGDGKDFEHVWVLLLQTHLLLQHSVRQGGEREQFWPQHPVDATMTDGTGGRASPSGNVLQVFAGTGGGVADRETALFAAVAKNRVYEAAGSKINRSFDLDVAEPQLMWTHDVQGSGNVPPHGLRLRSWNGSRRRWSTLRCKTTRRSISCCWSALRVAQARPRHTSTCFSARHAPTMSRRACCSRWWTISTASSTSCSRQALLSTCCAALASRARNRSRCVSRRSRSASLSMARRRAARASRTIWCVRLSSTWFCWTRRRLRRWAAPRSRPRVSCAT